MSFATTLCNSVPRTTEDNKYCSLHAASEAGNEATIASLLQNTSQVDVRDPEGRTSLWYASSRGHTAVARMLIERGADVNCCANDGVSCISAAVTGRHINAVRLLLDNRADVNKEASNKQTPLKIAIELSSVALVGLLLEHDARVSEFGEQDYSPLCWSACRGKTAIVNWLLDHGEDVNECDHNGCSCLMAAVCSGRTDTVRALLQTGADVNQSRDDGRSPLTFAVRENYVEIVKILLDHGARTGARDNSGWTALYWAARKGHCQLIGLLLAAGADVNASSNIGQTCLMAAVYNRHADVVRELIQKQANVNLQRRDGASALHVACDVSHADIAEILINNGARLDIRDSKGWMALQWSASVGNVEIVRRLIDRQLLNNNKSYTVMLLQHRVVSQGASATALELACSCGHMDVVALIQEVLVKLQAGIRNNTSSSVIHAEDGIDSYCNTPLHLCCDVQQAVSLLESGANLEAENVDGLRPIHFAVRTGLVDLVDLLISHGATLDATDMHGNSPLHEAVCCSLSVVELLVRSGARTCVRNNDGKTPYHVAAYFHKTDVVQFLQNYHTPQPMDFSPMDKSQHSELHRLVAADVGLNCMSRMSNSVEDTVLEITDVNKQNYCGHTPLHVARGQRAIEALLKCGNAASLTTKDTTGRNYLHLICSSRNMHNNTELKALMKSTEEMKIEVKVGLDATDNFGRTPLHYAAMTQAQVPFFDYILSVVPKSLARQDMFGRTPLHYERIAGGYQIHGRSSTEDRAIRDEFNMTEQDYGNCRRAYKLWEMFCDIYPGKDFTLILPELVEENLRRHDEENCSLRHAIRSIRGHKDPSAYINSIPGVCQYRYVSGGNKSATFADIGAIVNRAMQSLADEISKIDERLTCNVVAVGSAFEGTKVGFCDEFDYMFVLTKLSDAVRVSSSQELPDGFVRLEPVDLDSTIWKQLLTVDGFVDTQTVKLLFETTAQQIFSDYPFQKQNDNLQVLNPVRYFDNIIEHVSKKSNMKLEIRLAKPVNGVHVLHDISVDIVPAIRVEHLPRDIQQTVLECVRATECHLALVQPHWMYPWMPWSQTSCLISFALTESQLVRHSSSVVKNAYMVVKHMAKYFSNDKWYSSHVVKTALLLCMEEEGLITNSSASVAVADGKRIQLKRKYDVEDDSKELVRWVRRVTHRLLCFAVQDFAPSFSIRNCPLPVWNNFEPYPKFSHMRLHRHRLLYNDLMANSFCSDIKSGRVGDYQLVNIQRAFVCSHLMYWSVVSDNDDLTLHFPPHFPPSFDCYKYGC